MPIEKGTHKGETRKITAKLTRMLETLLRSHYTRFNNNVPSKFSRNLRCHTQVTFLKI